MTSTAYHGRREGGVGVAGVHPTTTQEEVSQRDRQEPQTLRQERSEGGKFQNFSFFFIYAASTTGKCYISFHSLGAMDLMFELYEKFSTVIHQLIWG